ncbi:MAG: ABC transporter permease [Bacteroidota bacterium]
MLKNYLKIAWRNLAKNKVTGFINIAGLAIGMAVAIMIGLWVQDELTYNQHHDNYDRIAQVYIHQSFNNKKTSSRAISLPFAPTLRNEFGDDFEHLALGSWSFEQLIAKDEKRFLKQSMSVEPEFPELFSFEMLAGDRKTALEEPNSILLAKSLADALFGQENPMGQIVRFESTTDLEVTGVFQDLPYNSEFKENKFFTTWELYKSQNPWMQNAEEQWGNHSFQLYAQIKPQASFEQVSQKIKDIEIKHNPDANPQVFLFPMSQWHLYSNFKNGENVGGRIQFVWMFSIVGVFVLLLACINFMNLSTARSEKRAKEVGIRKAVGSMRGQLIGQFLSESLVVTTIALFLSVLFVQLSMDWFNNLADKELAIPYANPIFWLGVFGFSIITGLLAGSYPAFYLSSFEPLKVLKGSFKMGKGASIPRQVLVTLQFTVSVALIIGTIVVFQQIQHAKNRPVGYNQEGIIQFFETAELEGKYDLLRIELFNTGVVEQVGYASSPITNIWSNTTSFNWEEKDPETLLSFGQVSCSPELGLTVGWNILEGRDFSRDMATDTASLILNEAAVAQTGLDNIVGKTIRRGDRPFTVIGVIQDMVMESPWRPIKPTIFYMDDGWVSVHNVRFKKGVPIESAIAKVGAVFTKLSPSSPFDYQFIDQEYERKFRSEERIGKLARFFAILAIFISCLGLFGLSAFVAEQRTKEIGIRKVLGASVTNLWALQSKSFLVLVLLSCLIAAPLAWYFLEGWLSDYDYRIELNVGVFLVAGLLALIVTLFTVSYQSIKAAMANPIRSLKTE